MSEIDRRTLQTNFEAWKKQRASEWKDGEAFERYAIELVLRDHDLSDDEIDQGKIGGGDDAGIDGFYFFIGKRLMGEDVDTPEDPQTAHLILIQATRSKGFDEGAIQKLESFLRDVLDWEKHVSEMTYFNSHVKDAITMFRQKYDEVMGSVPKLTISFNYVTWSTEEPHAKVKMRAANVQKLVHEQIDRADVPFIYWTARKLLRAFRMPPKVEFGLRCQDTMATDDGSFLALVRLSDFFDFIKDDDGNIREALLEPNVRAYLGRSNPVNKDIRGTLESKDGREFWWLNNGITILAENCQHQRKILTITAPQIVNGLQTSQEIFEFFDEKGGATDHRRVLVRVIPPKDEHTRSDIIRATNKQTNVSDLSLHAMDRVHFDIEDRFKLFNLFYERRKNYYRAQRKPIDRIVSIEQLSKCVMAILLQRPEEARARPGTFMKQGDNYGKIFSTSFSTDIYVVSILIDRATISYIGRAEPFSKDERRDVRSYANMLAAAHLIGKSAITASDLEGILKSLPDGIPETITHDSCHQARRAYLELGGTDRVAKGNELREMLIAELTATYDN